MAPKSEPLFVVPIEPLGDNPGGTVTCTEPSPQIYLLTFHSPPDNRLTSSFINAMLAALDKIEAEQAPGVVVTTSAITKFYSNGLDLSFAKPDIQFFERNLYRLLRRFLTYPMPTVALVNGHAFAGGFMLAMHHDYRVMDGGPDSRGYLCVNEVDFGAPIPFPLLNIYLLKAKHAAVRDTVLEARRWTAETALRAELIDSAEGWGGVEKLVKERGLRKKGATGVYRLLKSKLYREQLALLDADGDAVTELGKQILEEAELKEKIGERVGKLKL